MRLPFAEDVYQYFKEYCEIFLLDQNSFLSSHEKVLTDSALQYCFERFTEKTITGKVDFDSKLATQFEGADLNSRLVFAHAEWLWSFAVDDIGTWRKKQLTKRITKLSEEELKEVYPSGFGSAGMYHKTNKFYEIVFVLEIIRFIYSKVQSAEVVNIEQVAEWMEAICLYQKYRQEKDGCALPDDFTARLPDYRLATANILLYAAFPDKYERIASEKHKRDILNSFRGMLSEEHLKSDLNTDEGIALVRQQIGEAIGKRDFDFYEDDYLKVWNYSLTEEGFSEVQGLQYKKAIILYGPPGTGKTHTAKKLAYALISHYYLAKKENISNYFKKEEDFTQNRVHRLQMHTNYNYEDFIAGIQLVKNETKVVPGKLFEICEVAEKDDLPHVLLLDEINRVDLSRLFGEVFSALENRGEEIDLALGGLKLKIPENLYVIGTMNEIDFSLEQIDFALRRRFLWFSYGYDAQALSTIIWEKDANLETGLKEDQIERFIGNATELNDEIKNIAELGEQYQVGHTFFAEIVEIYKSYKELNGYTNRIQNQLFRNGGPASILWDISIEPILSAFLGNLDKETKSQKLQNLKTIYMK